MNEKEYILEAILFAAGEEVQLERLAASAEMDAAEARELLYHMRDRYAAEKRGLQIIEINDCFQMCTNPLYYPYIEVLYKQPQKKTLTQPLLETLAIIASLQPVTKGRIEEIRGVNADHTVNRLLEYGLICENGRLDAPGRPILFSTSVEFLKFFGFNNIRNLPNPEKDDCESTV